MPLGEVPDFDQAAFGTLAYQSGGVTPWTGTIAEWANASAMMFALDSIVGCVDMNDAGYGPGWIQSVRDYPGSANVIAIAHGGEHCQENTVHPIARRKGYWSRQFYNQAVAASSPDTNAFVHGPDGALLHTYPYDGWAPLVNYANQAGREAFAAWFVAELNHSDNRVPYVGLLFDSFDPWWGYSVWNETRTALVGAAYAYDPNLDGYAMGDYTHGVIDQRLRRDGMIQFFDDIRDEIRATNADSVANYVVLGANSDYAFSDVDWLAGMDVVYLEDSGCPMYLRSGFGDNPRHNLWDENYSYSTVAGYSLLDNYGEFPNPLGFTVIFPELSTYVRDDAGGPWVIMEDRTGTAPVIDPEYNEVYSLLFDGVYGVYLDNTYSSSSGRRCYSPIERGLYDLRNLGSALAAAVLDTTTTPGIWSMSRAYENGDVYVQMPDRADFDCDIENAMEYQVVHDAAGVVRESAGWPLVLDTTPPTLTPTDSTYTESLELAAVNVTSDEAWYPSYRTRVNAGSWSSYAIADTLTDDFTAYLSTASLTDGDVVRFGIGGTDAALNAVTEVYRDVTVGRAPAAPTGLAATDAQDDEVPLDWDDNVETDLASYNVYRGVATGSLTLYDEDIATSAYTDNSVTNDSTYYYAVTAVDDDGNESEESIEVNATPSEPAGLGSYRTITIAASDVDSTLVNYILGVKFSSESWLLDTENSGNVRPDGFDIFFGPDTTRVNCYDFEIESFDGTTGSLSAWVRIPTLSSSVDNVVYMMYGNEDNVDDISNIPSLWQDYALVWHMSSMTDIWYVGGTATVTAYDTAPTQAEGVFGGAYDLAGIGHFRITGARDATNPNYPSNGTALSVQCFYYLRDINSSYSDVLVANASPGTGVPGWEMISNGALSSGTDGAVRAAAFGSPRPYDLNSPTVRSLDTWHYVMFSHYNTDEVALYVDGDFDLYASPVLPAGTPINDWIAIGVDPRSGAGFVPDGLIDEIRIQRNYVSFIRAQLEYENYTDPTTFYTVGSEQ